MSDEQADASLKEIKSRSLKIQPTGAKTALYLIYSKSCFQKKMRSTIGWFKLFAICSASYRCKRIYVYAPSFFEQSWCGKMPAFSTS